MSLVAEQQDTWDTLKGITDPTVRVYADGKTNQAKYLRIQRALNLPRASFQPVKAVRAGPGKTYSKWEDGIEELHKFMPQRRRTIANAMRDIEEKIGEKVYWGKMTFVYKYVYTRYHEDIVLGADVLIEGVATNTGTVNYYYDNSSSAEGAHRFVIINGKKDTI